MPRYLTVLLVLLKEELSTRLVQCRDDQKSDDFLPQRKSWLLEIMVKTYVSLGRKRETKHTPTSLVQIVNFKRRSESGTFITEKYCFYITLDINIV